MSRADGRPPQLQVRLREDLLDRLQTEAAARTVSVNLLINRAVEQFLDDLVPVADVLARRNGTAP